MLVLAVFIAAPLFTSLPIVRLNKLFPESLSPPSPPAPEANMPCLPPMASNYASHSPVYPPAAMVIPALTSIVAASVVTFNMVLIAVGQHEDPRHVVTPLDAHRAELLLYKYDIYDNWLHIIKGLHLGFNVRI